MLLFCPACQAAFPGVSRCPRCGGLLLMPHEVDPDAPRRRTEVSDAAQPTVFGRVVLGTVLALGAYIAVRRLLDGVMLALDPASQGWWLSFRGTIVIHCVQAAAVLFGALIAGAGQAKGSTLGLVVGGACGGLFVGFDFRAGASSQDIFMILQLPVLALVGSLGGAVGVWVWQLPLKVATPFSASSKLSSIQLKEVTTADRARPTEWSRVLIGTMIMVFGIVLAQDIKEGAETYSDGLFKAKTLAQSEFIVWQVALFSTLIGGAVAGAVTGAGIRHGTIAGLMAGFAVFGLGVKRAQMFPAVLYWLEKFGLHDLPFSTPGVIGCVIGSIAFVGLLGGWLGGTLFLPLAPAHMRRRVRAGMD